MEEIILTESQYSHFSETAKHLVDGVPDVVDPLSMDDMHDFNSELCKQVNCVITFFMEHEGYTREQALSLVENFINPEIV